MRPREIFATIRDSMTAAERAEVLKMADAYEAAADQIEEIYADRIRMELTSHKLAQEVDQVELRRLVEKMQDEFALLRRLKFSATTEEQ